MRTVRRCVLACIFAVCVVTVAGDGSRAASPGEYQARWHAANTALVAFAVADITREGAGANPAALAAVYRREREHFATALGALSRSLPPDEATLAHWELLPRYEEVLGAMTLVCAAADRRDAAGLSAGWTALRHAVNLVRRTAEGLSQ